MAEKEYSCSLNEQKEEIMTEIMAEIIKKTKDLKMCAQLLVDKVFELKLNKFGEYEEALKFFNKAIEKNNQYARAYLNKGWALRKLGREDEVEEPLLKALKLDGQFAKDWLEKEVKLKEFTREEVDWLYFKMISPGAVKPVFA